MENHDCDSLVKLLAFIGAMCVIVGVTFLLYRRAEALFFGAGDQSKKEPEPSRHEFVTLVKSVNNLRREFTSLRETANRTENLLCQSALKEKEKAKVDRDDVV